MVFSENQEQKESYIFKDMMFQPDKSYFILAMIKQVGEHESRNNLTLMKKSEVNNKHKNNDGKLKTILSIWYLKRKIFPYEGLMKHIARLCAHEGIK